MELDLRDYLKIIRKRIWMILALVVVSCLATGIVSYFFIKPTYEASTKLIVNKSNDAAGAQPLDYNTLNMNLKLVDTYKEIIKTPRIMDKVVQQHPELGLTAAELIDKVQVSSVNNTQVMTLKVDDRSYERAAGIVNAVSEVFRQEIPQIMKVDNVSLLNEAQPQDDPVPVKPNKKLNIAISFVVALMIGVGIAFLLEYFDDTIKTEEDIRTYLDLPTLAMITKIRDEDVEWKSTAAARKAGEVQGVPLNQ